MIPPYPFRLVRIVRTVRLVRRCAALAALGGLLAAPTPRGEAPHLPPSVKVSDSPSASEAVRNPGALVIVGGGLDPGNEAVYRAILEARHGEGPICVVGTAGADPEGSSASAVARFARWGGDGVARAHPLPSSLPEAVRDPVELAALAECSGYFFVGGVQSRIVDLFRSEEPGGLAPAGQLLVDRWREGAVVSGSSAGAAMMSDPMIAGGTSQGAFQHGLGEGGVRLSPGLGFLPDLLVDQHFLARGRIGRLLVAALEPGGVPLAAGIDENTALVVRGSELEVVGASGVVIVDAREAVPISGGYGGVRVELLGPGDRFSTHPGAMVRPSAAGEPLGPRSSARRDEAGERGDGALFDRWVFLHLLEEAARSALLPEGTGSGEAMVEVEVEGEGRLRISAAEGFRALGHPDGEGKGAAGSTAGLSVGPLQVEVWRGTPQ